MTKLAEIQAALQQLPKPDRDELRLWLLDEETPEMLAAIDQGVRSLETEPTISAEEMRRRFKFELTPEDIALDNAISAAAARRLAARRK